MSNLVNGSRRTEGIKKKRNKLRESGRVTFPSTSRASSLEKKYELITNAINCISFSCYFSRKLLNFRNKNLENCCETFPKNISRIPFAHVIQTSLPSICNDSLLPFGSVAMAQIPRDLF